MFSFKLCVTINSSWLTIIYHKISHQMPTEHRDRTLVPQKLKCKQAMSCWEVQTEGFKFIISKVFKEIYFMFNSNGKKDFMESTIDNNNQNNVRYPYKESISHEINTATPANGVTDNSVATNINSDTKIISKFQYSN